VADTAGNPLALVELAAELTTAELSGAEPLDWPLRFEGRLDELYRSRVRALPGGTQTLLLWRRRPDRGARADLERGQEPGDRS
jgi:hypothetical protein